MPDPRAHTPIRSPLYPPRTPPRGSAPPPGDGPMLLPRSPWLRRGALALMDATLLAAGLALEFELWLRFRHGTLPEEYARLFFFVVGPMVAIRLALLAAFGLYRSIGRHAGVYELTRIALASTLATAVLVVANALLPRVPSIFGSPIPGWPTGANGLPLRLPWGVVFNDWTFSILAIGGVRILRRDLARRFLTPAPGDGRRVLIVGAGDTGVQVARDLERATRGAHRAVAYVDPNPDLRGSRIHGLPVAGTLDELDRVVAEFRVDDLVVALQRPTPRVLGDILGHCRRARLGYKIVPPLDSVMSGRVEVGMLRPIEIEDLLGREPVRLDPGGDGWMRGKRVLVTGAGGSIGRELCRQALAQRPESIALLGRGENSLFEALLELTPEAEAAHVGLRTIVCDARDEPAMRAALADFRPHVVFHAAAHKHVHFMEAQPCEAVKNNVLGTLATARAARAAGVERFVLISTDKAVRPAGIMGATKRVAEGIVRGMAAEASGTWVSVRFGNVLGSRGSVVPTFRRQIERGGPVTVTHPDVTRYFMTIPEAVSLVLEAGARGRGGEVLLLDMGKPVRIADLARNLITLSGLEPDVDIQIVHTGLRPGEKLSEDLLTDEEGVTATEHGRIYRARSEGAPGTEALEALLAAAAAGDDARVRELLRGMIPDARLA